MADRAASAEPAWQIDSLNKITITAGHSLERVHPNAYGPAQFNDTGAGDARFSPIRNGNGDIIPTAYAADTYEGALMETAFHDVPNGPPPKIVRKKKLETLVRSTLRTTAPLVFADLSSVGLKTTNATKGELIESTGADYPRTRSFAEAVHAEHRAIQGLRWVSKQHDQEFAYLLFGDRIDDSALTVVQPARSILKNNEEDRLLNLATTIGVDIGN
jgi:hypothetical protein